MYAYEGIGSIYWHMVTKLLGRAGLGVGAPTAGAEPGDVSPARPTAY
jgi:hypothetical protein